MSDNKAYQVVMPKLGLIMTEANLLEWFKKDGEKVQKGEPLFSFESDKSAVEIEAPVSGYVKTLISSGTTVPIQTPIAIIYSEKPEGESGLGILETEEIQPSSPFVSPSFSTGDDASKVDALSSAVRATPKARKAARDLEIDLANLTGSGLRGMITTSDLDKTPKRSKARATPLAQKMAEDCGISLAEVAGSGPGGRITRDDVTAAIAALTRSKAALETPGFASRPLPLEGLRGLIAERLSTSWNERPQVTLYREVDASQLIELRQHNLTPTGDKISLNAYFFTAVAKALREFPFVNAQLTESGLVHIKEINIGIAIDTERGLVVPVLKDVGERSLLDIHNGLNDLVKRTLSGKALPDDFIDGTFTITNLGAFGVDSFAPIINPPEAAILGVGSINPKPVAIERMIGIRDMVTLSLSFDHRLIDGAPAARFLNYICQLLADPERLK